MNVTRKLLVFVATVCALIITVAITGGQTVRADTNMSWDLGICNAALQNVNACAGTPPVNVNGTLNTAATQITLVVTAASNFKLWDGGIFGFSWVGPAITAVLSASTGTAAPYSVTADNGAQLDGFGTFSNAWDLHTAGVGGSSNGPTSLTFTLTGTGLSFADFSGNGSGHLFASHVVALQLPSPGNPTTGYVGNGGNPPANVPEPMTYLLVGAGLIGIVTAKFRRTA